MTKFRLFTLVAVVALFAGLALGWNTLVASNFLAAEKLQTDAALSAPSQLAASTAINLPAEQSTSPATPGAFSDADYTRHIDSLNERIKTKLGARGAHGFSVVIQKPFVVVGDESQKVVQRAC